MDRVTHWFADPATALLVDLDGTITDSFDGITRSFCHALDAVGAARPDDAFLRTIVGPPLPESFRAYGLGEPEIEAALTAYRARYDDVGWLENSVYTGMDTLLADLAASGRVMAVATSKNETVARRIVEHFGLSEYFAHVAGSVPDTRGTKAEVIAHALDVLELDTTATRVVMIGDRSHDVAGAAEHNIPTVGVTWGYALPGELAAAQADAQASHCPDEDGGPGVAPVRGIVDSVPRLREELGV